MYLDEIDIEMINVIKSAKELLSDESRWTPDCPAVNKDNMKISPLSEHAVKWSMHGAIMKSVHQIKQRYESHHEELLNATKFTLLYEVYHNETVNIAKQANYKQIRIINNEINGLDEQLGIHELVMSYFDRILESADYVE